MKNRKILSIIIIMILSIIMISCGKKEEFNYSKKQMNVYYKTIENKETIDLYYSNNDKNYQIPYITLDNWSIICNKIYNDGIGDYPKDVDFKLTTSYKNNTGSLLRENNTSMVFDFKNNTITFDNYDRFIAHSYDVSPQELPHKTGYDENNQPSYFLRVVDEYNYTNGSVLNINLNEYHIDILQNNDLYLVPFQTLIDLTLNMQYCNILYNTKSVYVMDYVTSTAEVRSNTGLIHDYYLEVQNDRSQELIEYTYNELCLLFDYTYGMKEEHNIKSFNEFFSNTYNKDKSLKELLKSTNIQEFEQGMAYLTNADLNDLHSSYICASYYSGITTSVNDYSEEYEKLSNVYFDLYMLRSEKYPDGMPGYEEVGNTAFITFDEFDAQTKDYYNEKATIDAPDTVGLFIYAYSQVYREGSPIENVVMDLSLNLGGYEDAVLFVCGMFTGKFMFSLENPITGAVSNSVYRVDANMDHVFDENDWFHDVNLYCLTSECSFSCGNVAPSILKANTNVTMLGRRSGGGACIVEPFTTASGGWYQTSSSKHIVVNHMNTYYNTDYGVEVDYRFDKLEDYYDRAKIVSFINSLI